MPQVAQCVHPDTSFVEAAVGVAAVVALLEDRVRAATVDVPEPPGLVADDPTPAAAADEGKDDLFVCAGGEKTHFQSSHEMTAKLKRLQ
eukprot:CAMPEP_0172301474 /NCGR_PEP_ID=MMETSP1058-20130122/3361_1 /TAXON_ID=83371 /ORGANISM="Detonula confervacea, Strain CCMP 353" /LENGTH=88 /DNA_ID=CAMNT_0013011609 /DNA_START=880 /DNA_END=1146 /DNA_ORIENTATION=-